MTSIKNRSRQVSSIDKVIVELGIPNQDFFDIARKFEIQLLIHPPENIEIYLVGSDYDAPQNHFSKFNKKGTLPINFTRKVQFLCLSPTEYDEALRIDGHRQSRFTAVTVLSDDRKDISNIYPHKLVGKDLAIQYILGFFVTTKSNTEAETNLQSHIKNKEIPIQINPEKLYILEKDTQTIREELTNKSPDYGKFKPSEWTSSKLAQLNEASTKFFSKSDNNTTHPTPIEIETIEQWLSAQWGPTTGKNPIEQAARAIIPDSYYSKSPPNYDLTEEQRSEYNNYTSTLLILINELAKKYWQDMIGRGRNKYATRDTIVMELTDTTAPWILSRRLASAIATIIKPDDKTQTRKLKN